MRQGSPRRPNPKTRGKVCVRCGRILTITEREAARTMPPALCSRCTGRELTGLEIALAALHLGRRNRKALRNIR